jgi:RNA polymerase sigma-70 factor (ECF subfamily)
MESWRLTLEELVRERGMALKRYAFMLCGDDGQADDLVQDALVRAFGRPLRAPRTGAAEGYLRVIMVNLFIDGTRRRTRWHRAMPLLAGTGATPDPAERVAERDSVLAALRVLPPRERACLVLRYYADLPVTEIAAALGTAEGTVRRYLSDATAKMGAQLAAAEGATGAEGEARR